MDMHTNIAYVIVQKGICSVNPTVGAIASLDETTNGKRGVAKRLRGAKKFVRSRIRAKAKAATRKLDMNELSYESNKE